MKKVDLYTLFIAEMFFKQWYTCIDNSKSVLQNPDFFKNNKILYVGIA